MKSTFLLFSFCLLTCGCTEPVEQPNENAQPDNNDPAQTLIDGEACETHERCESRICGDDGTCLSRDLILYVSKDGESNNDCGTFGSPCLNIQEAVEKTNDGLTAISVGQGSYDEQIAIHDKKVELVGLSTPTITFTGSPNLCTSSTNTCIIDINDNSKVTLSNFSIDVSEASGASNNAAGISYGPDRSLFPIREDYDCLLYTSPSPRDATLSRMPSSA